MGCLSLVLLGPTVSIGEGVVSVTGPVKYKSGFHGDLALLVLSGPQSNLTMALCHLPILSTGSFPKN